MVWITVVSSVFTTIVLPFLSACDMICILKVHEAVAIQ